MNLVLAESGDFVPGFKAGITFSDDRQMRARISLSLSLSVCVCACVCERERGRVAILFDALRLSVPCGFCRSAPSPLYPTS